MILLRRGRPSRAFTEVLEDRFSGAVPQTRYLEATAVALGDRGFTHRNTLACVATCRDELSAPLHTEVEDLWGPSFGLSSLAGMLTAGRTGFMAAVGHAPVERGQRRLALYAMAHVGIDDDGTIGEVRRAGLAHPSHACGALAAVRDGLLSGAPPRTSLDPFDAEQSLLTRRLVSMIPSGSTPDLAELSKLTICAIDQDVWDILARFSAAPEPGKEPLVSVAGVFTGIQIHGPRGRNYVWPHAAQFVEGSASSVLELPGL